MAAEPEAASRWSSDRVVAGVRPRSDSSNVLQSEGIGIDLLVASSAAASSAAMIVAGKQRGCR